MVSNFVLAILLVLVFFLAVTVMAIVFMGLGLAAAYWWGNKVYKNNEKLNNELDKFEGTRYIVDNIEAIVRDMGEIEITIKSLFEMNVFDDDPIVRLLMEQSSDLLNKLDGFSAISNISED